MAVVLHRADADRLATDDNDIAAINFPLLCPPGDVSELMAVDVVKALSRQHLPHGMTLFAPGCKMTFLRLTSHRGSN
ncbi:hypothetical protein D8L93_03130 [Sodalis-like symbiont of Bactericera trigonica]|nr:hypothetical protein D8L93_03130 [Sodalis-like symbiont of Bactericera trigonica]